MKKFAVAVLSLGLLGALPAAQAATVSVDAGTFIFSYDDSFLAGSSFSNVGNSFTFGGLGLAATSVGGVNELDIASKSADGYFNVGYPITITAKAGYQIIGLTESVSGRYEAVAGSAQDAMSGLSGSLLSRWVYANGVVPLGQNMPYQTGYVVAGQDGISGEYKASGSLDFLPVITSEGLAPGSIVLSSLYLQALAMSHGNGSGAVATLNQYQIGVQTAAVPEPESVALLLAGLGVVGAAVVRRNKR
ncbi:MAG: PEP-CTERM sorting domain-containing protein [Aquabacterium sp.]